MRPVMVWAHAGAADKRATSTASSHDWWRAGLGLVGSGGKYTTKWESTEGLDMNAEFDALQKEIQSIWDKAGGG